MRATADGAARRADAPKGAPWRRHLARPTREGDWSVAGLGARCAQLRDHLAARGWATEAELAEAWPPARGGVDAWQHAYATYCRFMGRAEARERSATPEGAAARDRALRAALAAALSDRPAPVALSTGQTVHVYPKSYVALELCAALGVAVGALQRAADALLPLDAAAHVPVVRALGVQVWCWAVTHPAAELPFSPHADVGPDAVPAWTAAIAPSDLYALWVAYHEVNRERLQLLAEAFPGDGRPSRLSFEGFLGTFSGEPGRDPLDVLHRWSVTRVVAVAVSGAIAAEEAAAAADAAAQAARA